MIDFRYIWILFGLLVFTVLIWEIGRENVDMNYFDYPNPDHHLEPLDQDPPEKFGDTTQLTTLTKIVNDGPTREKSFIGRPPSLYGPRVYRTLAQN